MGKNKLSKCDIKKQKLTKVAPMPGINGRDLITPKGQRFFKTGLHKEYREGDKFFEFNYKRNCWRLLGPDTAKQVVAIMQKTVNMPTIPAGSRQEPRVNI